jgi:hypothetical protein
MAKVSGSDYKVPNKQCHAQKLLMGQISAQHCSKAQSASIILDLHQILKISYCGRLGKQYQ